MRCTRLEGCLLALASVMAGGCASSPVLSSGVAGGPFFQPVPARTPKSPVSATAPSGPQAGEVDDISHGPLTPAAPPTHPASPAVAPSRFAPLTGDSSQPRPGFGRTLLQDTKFVLASPLRWDGHDWFKASLAVAGVAALMPLDEAIAHRAEALHSPAADQTASAVQELGDAGAFGVIGGFYLAGLAFHDDRAKEVARDGLISSVIAGGIITPLLKEVTGRLRPRDGAGEEDLFTPFGGSASFPSGHTTEAFAVASVVAAHYDRRWVKALSYSLAGLVGVARIEQDAHFASDVLAGALIGTAVGTTVVHFNDERRHEPGKLSFSAGPLFSRDGPGVTFHIAF